MNLTLVVALAAIAVLAACTEAPEQEATASDGAEDAAEKPYTPRTAPKLQEKTSSRQPIYLVKKTEASSDSTQAAGPEAPPAVAGYPHRTRPKAPSPPSPSADVPDDLAEDPDPDGELPEGAPEGDTGSDSEPT